ncbi:MAG: metallopeptidase family protein [Thermoguttaceae bacterium]
MNQKQRDLFDKQVEWVISRLPLLIQRLIEEVPIHVKDRPSRRIMRELNVKNDEDLCGYYSGIAIGEKEERSYLLPDRAPILPDHVMLFRRGIIEEARNEWGKLFRNVLRERIRVTILHELGHHHGMSEDELAALGYD